MSDVSNKYKKTWIYSLIIRIWYALGSCLCLEPALAQVHLHLEADVAVCGTSANDKMLLSVVVVLFINYNVWR